MGLMLKGLVNPTFCTGIFLSGGQGCGTIIRRVAAAATCESLAIDFWIFLTFFWIFVGCWMFGEMSGPLSHAVYRKVHNCGPFN